MTFASIERALTGIELATLGGAKTLAIVTIPAAKRTPATEGRTVKVLSR